MVSLHAFACSPTTVLKLHDLAELSNSRGVHDGSSDCAAAALSSRTPSVMLVGVMLMNMPENINKMPSENIAADNGVIDTNS